MAHLFDERVAGLDSPLHDFRQFDLLSLECDLALVDAADVHQIVDQPGHRLRLPVDDIPRPLQLRDGRSFHPQEFDGVPHRGQRVTKFVGQRRQEIVLAAVDLGQVCGVLT